MTELVKYEAARRALAEAVAVDEVKDVRDQAEAMRLAARIAGDKTLEIQAGQLRFRAERALGEMIIAQKETVGLNRGRAGAGRPSLGRSDEEQPKSDERADTRPTLAEVGIDRKLSMKAQKLAQLPAETFETRLEQHAEEIRSGRGRVAMDLLKVNAEQEQREARRDLAKTLSDASVTLPGGDRIYPCIYADPPWIRKQGIGPKSYENHYVTMTWPQIIALMRQFRDRLAPDSWFYCWIPRAHLLALVEIEDEVQVASTGEIVTAKLQMPLAWAVAKAIGMDSYSTCYVWTKTDEEHPNAQGTGKLVYDQDELLLQFRRGRGLPMPDGAEKFGSNHRERATRHSAKPLFYRDMIATMVGCDKAGEPLPVLEMFARFDPENPPPRNWDLWGNQAEPAAERSDARGLEQAAVAPVADVSSSQGETFASIPRREEVSIRLNGGVVVSRHYLTDLEIHDLAGRYFARETVCPPGHAISMSLDGEPRVWCACGAEFEFSVEQYRKMDASIEIHFAQIEAAASMEVEFATVAEPVVEAPAIERVSEALAPVAELRAIEPVEISEYDALKALSDFCHPRRAEICAAVAEDYAARGMAIRQGGTNEWILREAGAKRLCELEDERRAAAPPIEPAAHPLDIPLSLRREEKSGQRRLDLVVPAKPDMIDDHVQTRLPVNSIEIEEAIGLRAIEAGDDAGEIVRHLVGKGWAHVTSTRIALTYEGREALASFVDVPAR